jgi:hypothetical protein
LRRDAQRAAVVFRDVDGLHGVAAARVDQPLARAVGGGRVADHRRADDPGFSRERRAERARQIRHRVHVVDESLVNPARYLARTKRLLSALGEPRGQGGRIEVEQVLHRHG